ncbi:MAG: HAD family phosphatase [Clostridia bacterium]|nr:HAD family phosphatase [Clostridia bacterium]
MIRNLLFDLVGVLMRFDTEGYYRAHGIGPGDAGLLRREVFGSLEWAMQDRGTISEADATASIASRVPARLHGAVRDFVRRENRAILPVPGMEALTGELKERGFGLYLLSNISAAFHRFQADVPALRRFDGIMISADVGLVKPDPEIFRLACRRFGIDPVETAFIDDAPANAEAALHVGMKAFVFKDDVDALRAWLDGGLS